MTDGEAYEYGKITALVKTALGEAQNLALTRDHQHLKAEHLLLTLLENDNTIAAMLIDQVQAVTVSRLNLRSKTRCKYARKSPARWPR